MSDINWNISKADHALVRQVARRAAKMAIDHGQREVDLMSIEMDLMATHLNGCHLDLRELLEASESDFGHDIYGISRHLNRNTGKLGNFFVPRYATQPAITKTKGGAL